MKRGTPEHFKTMRLATLLSTAERPCDVSEAVGLLEMLFNHVAPRSAPQGNVGRLSNQELAVACHTSRNADRFVDALVESGWLEADDAHRLLIHDWEDHADEAVRKYLSRHELPFLKAAIGMVYFLLNREAGTIKIGRTRQDLAFRVATLERECGAPLEVLATVQGHITLERDLHRRFAESCVGGEWFRDTSEIREIIAAYTASRRVRTRRDKSKRVDPPRAGTGTGKAPAEGSVRSSAPDQTRARGARTLPDDFQVTADVLSVAHDELRLTEEQTAYALREWFDYARAAKRTFHNWDSATKNALRRFAERGAKMPNGNGRAGARAFTSARTAGNREALLAFVAKGGDGG